MNRLNSVVIKLWLTIILIVATVLILLSVSLITFIQYYFTQAIQNSQTLIDGDGPGGLIIMKDMSEKPDSSYKDTKKQMFNEIKKSTKFKKVFKEGEYETQNITIKNKGNSQSYLLLGYPMKAQKGAQSHYSGVFIYKDLKSIEDTNNAITIIILITAIIFTIASTIFAFFLSNRITKPLRQLKTQAQKVSEGDYSQISTVATKDEIGDLSRAFNNMNVEIQEHIKAISSSKNIRDTLLNSMVEGVLGINNQREIILSNKMADDIMRHIDDFSKESIEQQIEATFESQQNEYLELEINTRYYVFISSYIDRIQTNGRSGIVMVIRDMTNEHNLDQMKKDFIANVSHELRTPISLLQGYTESIVDGIVTEPDEIRDSLAIVLDESKRLNRLVNELLNVARMDAEGLSVEKELQPIQHLLDKMESKYRMQSEELGLTMTFDSNNDEQLWNYDMDRMDQVLTNLIDNATRYTQAGDSIKISIDEDSDFNILTITDTGTGIAPEHLKQVFDRFYKVDAARKRGKQGTGLGLFICKMIIEEHGGRIDVESELGKGTSFIIRLPKSKQIS